MQRDLLRYYRSTGEAEGPARQPLRRWLRRWRVYLHDDRQRDESPAADSGVEIKTSI